MGASSPVSITTLIPNDFCTATSSTSIQCTTAFTGTGDVVLASSPTLSGTVTAGSSTWSGQIAVGTSAFSGAANINGTVTATLFAGSGASLTALGTTNLTATTGTASNSTYLRGDGKWATMPAASLTIGVTTIASGTTTRILFDNAGILGEYLITGTDNVVMSASPTLTGTITAANINLSGNTVFGFGSNYTTTGAQQDVAINTASSMRYAGAGTATFYGIVAGTSGQILHLHNGSSSVLTLANKSASETTATNQIVTGTGSDLPVAANAAVVLQYDSSAANSSGATGAWRVIGGSGGSGAATPAGTTGQVQYNSGSNTLAATSSFTWLNANNQLVVGTGAATPLGLGTTGQVAGIVHNHIPQGFSFGSLAGSAGAVSVNPATIGQMAYFSGANSISGTPNLYVSGSNIGIGTATAVSQLQILGGAGQTTANLTDAGARSASLAIDAASTTAGAGAALTFGNSQSESAGSIGMAAIKAILTSNTGNTQGDLAFSTRNATSDTALTERMRITAAGKVGIGSNNPANALDVTGTVAATTYIGSGSGLTAIGTANLSAISGSPGSTTYLRGDGTWATPAAGGSGTVTSSTAGQVAYFASSGSTIIGTSSITISATGQVGIGTSSPTAALTVNGASAFLFGANYTATGSQQDVAINTASSVRYTGAAPATFFGIVAGTNGQVLHLHNGSSSVLTLADKSASETTSPNQIVTATGTDLSLTANSAVILQYDTTASNTAGATGAWRVIGGSGSGSALPAGTTGQVQYNTGSNSLGATTNFTWLSANNQLVVGTSAATPIGLGTTGQLAGIVHNFIPQGFSFSSLAGSAGPVSVSPATIGQMAYYSSASAIAGTPNLYVSGSNIAIGTATALSQLQILGGAGQTSANLTDAGARTASVALDATSTTTGAGAALTFGNSQSEAAGSIGMAAIKAYLTSNTGNTIGDLVFATRNATSDTNLTERMRIISTGGIGIGTNSPGSNALQVNGAIAATTFSGSGTSLTGIGTGSLGGVAGTPSSTTYLRGDGQWASAGGGSSLFQQQVFKTSGTFTTPAGSSLSTVYHYRMVGGGAGGGGYGGGQTAGSGGGAGAYGEATFTNVAPSTAITITVGAAGTGGSTSAGSGTAGGSTTIGAPVSVTAGGGGAGVGAAAAGAWTDGGAGGTITAGSPTISIAGGKGNPGHVNAGSGGINFLANGGSSPLGQGGNGGAQLISASGFAASGYGAGGGGGIESGGTGGGAGTPGIVIIEWVQ